MKLITTRQAAELLGVDVSTISRWVAFKRLTPAMRLENGHMLFDPADVEAFIAANRPPADDADADAGA
jgi:excisionase family DNA binding protein